MNWKSSLSRVQDLKWIWLSDFLPVSSHWDFFYIRNSYDKIFLLTEVIHDCVSHFIETFSKHLLQLHHEDLFFQIWIWYHALSSKIVTSIQTTTLWKLCACYKWYCVDILYFLICYLIAINNFIISVLVALSGIYGDAFILIFNWKQT